jgi:hypothetical protein
MVGVSFLKTAADESGCGLFMRNLLEQPVPCSACEVADTPAALCSSGQAHAVVLCIVNSAAFSLSCCIVTMPRCVTTGAVAAAHRPPSSWAVTHSWRCWGCAWRSSPTPWWRCPG